jgi:hypothetical protein
VVLDSSISPTTIGRYFSVVSAIPSTLFVGYLYLLVRSGAWSGAVHFASISKLEIRDAALFGLLSLVTAIALHPLQFSLIQFFEGYWNANPLSHSLATIRVRHHRRRAQQAMEETLASLEMLERQSHEFAIDSPYATDDAISAHLRVAEADRRASDYPRALRHIMPTRLGNVLRRHELMAGEPYGLAAIQTIPRVGMVAQDREVEYVENQRLQLELAIRTSFLGLLATLSTCVFMWRHGLWLLLGLVPYAIAYLAYRGSVVIAHEYGSALAVIIELNRFALYERLRLPPPPDLAQEIRQNARLMAVFRRQRASDLSYASAQVAPPSGNHAASSSGSANGSDT